MQNPNSGCSSDSNAGSRDRTLRLRSARPRPLLPALRGASVASAAAVIAIAITGAAGTRVAGGKRTESAGKVETGTAAIATGIAASATGRAAMARETKTASGTAGAIALEM